MINVWPLARVVYIERNNWIQQIYRYQSWLVLLWMSLILLCTERGRITALSTLQLTLSLRQKVDQSQNQSWLVLHWMSWVLLCTERGRITALSTLQFILSFRQKVEKLDSQVWPQVPLWSISHQRKSKLLKFLDRLDLDVVDSE